MKPQIVKCFPDRCGENREATLSSWAVAVYQITCIQASTRACVWRCIGPVLGKPALGLKLRYHCLEIRNKFLTYTPHTSCIPTCGHCSSYIFIRCIKAVFSHTSKLTCVLITWRLGRGEGAGGSLCKLLGWGEATCLTLASSLCGRASSPYLSSVPCDYWGWGDHGVHSVFPNIFP